MLMLPDLFDFAIRACDQTASRPGKNMTPSKVRRNSFHLRDPIGKPGW